MLTFCAVVIARETGVPTAAAVEEREVGRGRGMRAVREGVVAGTTRFPDRPKAPSLVMSVGVGRPEQ